MEEVKHFTETLLRACGIPKQYWWDCEDEFIQHDRAKLIEDGGVVITSTPSGTNVFYDMWINKNK